MSQAFRSVRPFVSFAGITAAALLAAGARAQSGVVQFSTHVESEVAGPTPEHLSWLDFDGDGDADIATGSPDGELTFAINDGTGDISENQTANSGVLAWGIGAADWNGDGVPDVAATDGEHSRTTVEIWAADPTDSGRFTRLTSVTAGQFPVAVVGADLDGDGDNDLVVANNVAKGVQVWLNDGAGSFTFKQQVPGTATFYCSGIVAGDFDENGKVDLAVSHYGGGELLVGNGDGTFTDGGGLYASSLVSEVAVADFDQDGHQDVALAQLYDDSVRVALGHGDGTFTFGGEFPVTYPGAIDARDLDGDGVPDLVCNSSDVDRVGVLVNHGDGTFAAEQTFATDNLPTDVVAVDLSQDGKADLCTCNWGADGSPTLSVLLNQSAAQPWLHRGHGLATGHGLPLLRGSGTPAANQTITLALEHAAPSAPLFVIAGTSEVDLDLFGGTLVPAPQWILPVGATNSAGALTLAGAIPNGVPPGLEIWLQGWILDVSGPKGFGASNGLAMVTQ